MAQKSMLYSSARVRVLEKKLINRDELQKLIDAPSAEDALTMLSERGYGVSASSYTESDDADTLRAMLSAEISEAGALLAELSADEEITNVFLYRSDITNLKLLIKRSLLGADLDSVELDGCAVLPPTLVRSMVKNATYFDLPREIIETLGKLHRELAENPPKPVQKTESEPHEPFDPAFISVELDRAYYRYARSMKNAFLNEYFSAECDFVNISALFRVKKRGGSVHDLERALMPEGDIKHEILKAAFAELTDGDRTRVPAMLVRDLQGDKMRAVLAALTTRSEEISPEAVELARDNYLMELIKQGKDDMDSIRPVIGFYMAKRREADSVRLIITLKRNGFSPDFIRQRLRAAYA